MKIKSAYIAAFGGLKGKTVNFGDGFNVIYGDNENGKTTVMAFLKMMFYGNERGSSAIAKNPRKKYSPWDGSAMAGSVDFCYNGRNYRLEREFKSSNLTDKVTLLDLDLGTRESVASDVGQKFFGLSAAAFERSVFIGQLGAADKDSAADGEINSKLSNIVTTGDESISFEAVYSKLEKAKLSLMSKRGQAGAYDKNMKQLSSLRERLENAEAQRERYEKLKSESEHIKDEIGEIKKRAIDYKKSIESEQDVRNAVKLKDMLSLKEKLDTLNSKLRLSDGTLIDEMFVRKLVFCISKIDAAEQKLKDKSAEADRLREGIELALNPGTEVSESSILALKNEISELEKQQAELKKETEELKSRYNEHENNHREKENIRKKVNMPLLIIAALALGITAVMMVLNPVIGAVTAVLTLIFAILAFVIRPLDKKKIADYENELTELGKMKSDAEAKQTETESELTAKTAKLEAINAALNSNSAIIDRQKALLNECEQQKNELKAESENERSALFTLYGHYKKTDDVDEIRNKLGEFSEKAAEQKEIKQQLNYIVRDIGNISYEEARIRLEKIGADTPTEIDFDALKKEYDGLCEKLNEKTASFSSLTAEIKALADASENPDTINKEINNLTEKTVSQEQFCKAADIAMATLAESFAELRRSYGSALEQKAGEIFTGLTSGKYESMQISNSFDICVEQTGVFGGKELGFLSSGASDQAYLSLRLALSSLISDTGEPLPVLLDDALTQYDDERTSAACEYLKKYSENGQIIMFTCHKSVMAAAKNAGADCEQL